MMTFVAQEKRQLVTAGTGNADDVANRGQSQARALDKCGSALSGSRGVAVARDEIVAPRQ
jgi:hypothetical protein